MKAPERVWRAAWGYAGRISADARDAAQIALHGAQAWGRRNTASKSWPCLKRLAGPQEAGNENERLRCERAQDESTG
jgi:hypothetical protein